MAPKRRSKRKSHFILQPEVNMQPPTMSTNHTDQHSIEKDGQNIQGTLNNQRDTLSNQLHVDVQDNIPYVENMTLVLDQNVDMNETSNEELSIQVLLQQRDERAHAEQYMRLVAFWNTEKSKEKEKGHPPTRVELFQACFTHANGSPSSNVVAEKLVAMNELANQLPEDSNDPVSQNDIFAQIIGPDRPGRVRMLGDGVSPSDLWGEVPSRDTCNRLVMEQKTKLEKMDEQVKKQGQHIAMLEAKISDQANQNPISNCNNSQHTSSSSNPQTSIPSRPSLRIGCSVLIKSLFDSTKIVAKGVLHSMDPNTTVGRQTLGPNWCEVQVQVFLKPEESLIRPYDFLQRFEDTLGGMIAWPYHLLTVNEDYY
ncbi:uncharacterized protein LOC122026514 [Zingiber officinale]|uniref:uncharacterized protein LOC122026514 n=1 Tax=Zingiber officinale TaxID=94328 RepID=UPI001C4D0720|nr:uncharacterized protein LOC122026514 [Zingiber officinale]